MSILRQVIGVAAPIVGGFFGGPAGAAAGMALGQAIQKPAAMPVSSFAAQPGSGMVYPAMGALPAIGAAAGTVARFGVGIVSRAGRGAIQLCRRYPQWCSTIGGTAAVAAMIESGQLPMPKRHRGRGLSARDLRGFRRTSRLMRQVASSIGLRKGGRGARGTSSTMITQN